MSWAGNILRVDLDAGTCAGEPLRRDWAALYLGQRGLATRYLSAEIDASVDALDPGNKLIFATGPLTGTLPERILKEPVAAGNAKGKVAELGKLLREYYALRGWDENGVPQSETLRRLGLE